MPVDRDISVDASHDIIVQSGDLVLCSDLDAIAQDCDASIRLVLGEWFLTPLEGLDWFGSILVKNPNLNVIRAQLRAVLLGVLGVKDVVALALNYTGSIRALVVTFTVNTDLGELTGTVTRP